MAVATLNVRHREDIKSDAPRQGFGAVPLQEADEGNFSIALCQSEAVARWWKRNV